MHELYTYTNDHTSPPIYCIVGNFCWCNFSHIWPKSPQNNFSYVLISHARTTRPRLCSSPMAYSRWQHGDIAPGLWAFLAYVSIIRLIKSLWVGRSRIWHSIAVCIISHDLHRVQRGQSSRKIFDGSNFRGFYFRMQNAHAKYAKISTMRKFPAIR